MDDENLLVGGTAEVQKPWFLLPYNKVTAEMAKITAEICVVGAGHVISLQVVV